MKPPYVRDLQPNQTFTSVFLVQSKDIRQKKSGEPYLSMVVGDRSGDLEAMMWDNVAEVMDTFDRDDFVRIRGLFQIFQNRPQMRIHKLIRVDDDGVNFADFFPASERDPGEMFAELTSMIAGFTNPHLRGLLDAIFADPRIARAYKIAPAAKQIHHAYLSGLLEHVLSLCKLANVMAAHYKNIDHDLLLTGVILHDLGKIDELTYHRGFGYSTEGQLLGHIVIGYRMIEEKLRLLPEFPPKLRMLLQHMILSHHGELAYGSPKVPVFPEALLLHHLDNLDSKMDCMRTIAEKDRHYEGCWTSYNNTLERAVLKKTRFMDEATPAGVTVAAAPPVQPEAQPPVASPLVAQAAPLPPAEAPLAAVAAESHPAESRPQNSGSLFGDKLKQALKS